MVRFPEATRRIFGNMFVCRKCKAKRKADSAKVLRKEVVCRKCGSTALRPAKKTTSKA